MSNIHQGRARRDSKNQCRARRDSKKLAARLVLLSSTALLPLTVVPSVLAQETASPQAGNALAMEEIVVTARRRAERLADVPVAVSAMGAEDIERYSSNNIGDIAQMTPNLNVASRTAGGAGAGITIRGIGTEGANVGFEQAVSINIDGVQVSRGRALWQSYFDIQQVEVLKGPQALFFGKNSPAGVVSIVTKGPTRDFEATGRIGYEFNADELIGEAAIGGPLNDAWGLRLAVRAREMQGWMRNDAVAQANPSPTQPPILPGARDKRLGEKELNGRLTLTYDDGGPLTATLKVTGTQYKDDGAVSQMEIVDCSGSNQVVLRRIFGGTIVDPQGDCKADWRIASTDIPQEVAQYYLHGRDGEQYSDQDSLVSVLSLSYAFANNLVLASSTGFYTHNSKYLMNNDWTSFASISATEAEKYEQVTQELRLYSEYDGNLNFMLGAYYQDSQLDFGGSTKLDDIPRDPLTGWYHTINREAATSGKTWSMFGQLNWDITPELELSGGARWTREEKKSFVGVGWSNAAVAAAFPVRRINLDFKDDDISPEATLAWRPNSDLMIYGAYKTGYKSGGAGLSSLVNAGLLASQVEYGPETVEGFEAGMKHQALDRRLQYNVTAYRYNFKDLQVSSWDPVSSSYFTANAARVRQQGIELEGTYAATSDLTLRGSLAYNHSRYRSYLNAQCYSGQTQAQGCIGGAYQDLSGRPTLNAPDWVAGLGFTFTQNVTEDLFFSVSSDVQYSDDYYYIQTQSPAALQDSFARLSASLRLFPSDERWELGLIGRNLTNEKVLVSGQDRPGGLGDTNGVLARPREVLLQVGYKF
ncbi:TonB-dependent receptor [Niveispirillum fermenti]|uniref:TonB-dependent receptor n=1 Tax=Niveispirillum fermenti TaxID=1233113 RepID=UPI003A8783AA